MAKNKSIIKLFEKSGEVGPQPNLLKMLKDKFVQMNLDEFTTLFIDCMMSVIVSQTTLHCAVVNNMIKFGAKSVSMLCEHSSKDGRTGMYLMTEMIRICRKYGHACDKTIRWRLCLFLNHLMNYMADGAVLAVELCEVVTSLLLDRLQDKKADVRAQAAHALNRLQTPDNPKCRIVEKFLFHLTCDTSIEVRTAIVKEIAMFNYVVDEMLKSTLLDVSDNVRKEAYNRFLTYPFSSLSSKQRQTLLEKGLEENKIILSIVKNRLLPKWLEECNNDFVQFLNKLDVENEIICEKTLRVIFESYYDSQILDLTNEYLNPVSRLIDFDKLTVEQIFLWKCVAKYLTTEKKIELARNQGHIDSDYIDILLPDLVVFSDYVRNYYFTYDSNNDKEFILTQLLDMTKTFSIDDVGAASLNKLFFDLLLDSNTSVRPIKHITTLLNLTFKNGHDLLIYIKQILNEIQTRTIDVYPLIEKKGKKELLKYQIQTLTKKVSELIEIDDLNSEEIDTLIIRLKKTTAESENMIILPEEITLVDVAVKNLLKAFELVFEVQQFPKVGIELSLLTDIVQNIVVGYLECSMVNLRMEAIRSLAPYMLANNAVAAKEHMTTLCSEVSKPMTDRHLLFQIMFEVFLRYDLKTFDINDNLDTNEEYNDVFGVESILPLLVNCIDYEVVDSSFKLDVIKGFCELLLFKKVNSINLLTKLLIIWFRRSPCEMLINSTMVQFFTSYVFNINTSSSTLAKCYVPMLKEIQEHDLASKLSIKLDEVNLTLINITRGLFYQNEKFAINAHGELASNILDYLIDKDQTYTDILVDTVYKLEIDFDSDDKLVQILGPKLMLVIEHLKKLNNKETRYYLKKIMHKFDPVLQKKASFMKNNIEKSVEIVEAPQVPSCSTQEPDPIVEVPHSDLFAQEQMNTDCIILSDSEDEKVKIKHEDDDEDVEAFTKLDAMKRMSEIFKQRFSTKVIDISSSDSE